MAIFERSAYSSLDDALAGDVRVWLDRTLGKGKIAIVNPDIDGLLSFCILKASDPSLRFGGYYENESQFLLTDEAKAIAAAERAAGGVMSSFVSIENDLLVMDSVGQHFCLLSDARFAKVNPNTLRFGYCSKAEMRRYLEGNFPIKYPLSTAFFLWTVLAPPGDRRLDDEQVIGLLFPDSAIIKDFANTYEENIRQWFEWMGYSRLATQFFRLRRSPSVRQIARCFYKCIGVTQPSVEFTSREVRTRVANVDVIQYALNYVCSLLNVVPSSIYDKALNRAGSYSFTRIRVERQEFLRQKKAIFYPWLELAVVGDASVKSVDAVGAETVAQVISEAVVEYGVWSVTTRELWHPPAMENVTNTHVVAAGRNSELWRHRVALDLDGDCIEPSYRCPYPTLRGRSRLRCSFAKPGATLVYMPRIQRSGMRCYGGEELTWQLYCRAPD